MIHDERSAREWFSSTVGASERLIRLLDRLALMLAEENQRQNLISRTSENQVWARHFVDSAQLLVVPRGTEAKGPWLDLGTGAGFPGLVIALARPDLTVHLVDSRRLRTDWLKIAVAALELGNVVVHHVRVEALPDLKAATISARAFAPLERLLTISARFSTPDTFWLLPKGASASQELEALSDRWQHVFHVEQSITDANAGIVVGHLLGVAEQAPPKG